MAFNDDEIKEYLRRIKTLGEDDIRQMRSRILRTLGFRILEYADDHAPVGKKYGGRLKESLVIGGQDNVFDLDLKTNGGDVTVGSAVPYAKHVNDGFTQKKGQFVPGYWEGNYFHYVPGDEAQAQGMGGMVLTGREVPGAKFFDIAVEAIDDDIEDTVEVEIRRALGNVGG